PVLILLGIAVAFAAGNLIISDLLGRKRLNSEKATAYECGMDAVGSARIRLSIHFYLVAVLFILFDVEAIFLILWATNAKAFAAAGVGPFVFAEVTAFVAVLALALAYVWRKGGLTWDR
ncbi:MAG: NADH-quinone oxidoreductase subunit A, partial [Planctomycetes bacterium]|nr:NADH-quinone oxidoreductase subunit A [Planctomycetota bacterium]